MDGEFIVIVQKLIAERGKDALIAKGKTLLADYTGTDYKRERRLFTQALEAGTARAIDSAKDLELCKQQQARLLFEDYAIDRQTAADVIDALAFVLRGDTGKTTSAPQVEQKPREKKSAPQSVQPSPLPVPQEAAVNAKPQPKQQFPKWLKRCGIAVIAGGILGIIGGGIAGVVSNGIAGIIGGILGGAISGIAGGIIGRIVGGFIADHSDGFTGGTLILVVICGVCGGGGGVLGSIVGSGTGIDINIWSGVIGGIAGYVGGWFAREW